MSLFAYLPTTVFEIGIKGTFVETRPNVQVTSSVLICVPLAILFLVIMCQRNRDGACSFTGRA